MSDATESMAPTEAPLTARHFVAGPWRVAIWVPTGGFHTGVRSAVAGPGGDGSAWLSAEPNAMGMQIGGVRATIGGDEVMLHRNRPRLRRRKREIRVVGEARRWAMTFPAAGSAQITDEATSEVLWRRDGTERTGNPTLTADDVAMLLLLDHVALESTAGGPLRMLRSL